MLYLSKLQEFGLNDKQAKVYISSLRLGPASVTKIAEQAKLKRTTTFEVIKSLQELQLLSVTAKGKRKQYVAQKPETLKIMIKKKEALLASLLPHLNSLTTQNRTKPNVQFFQGEDGIKELYNQTLQSKETIYAFSDYTEASRKLKIWLNKYYIPRRVKKQIYARVISPLSLATQRNRKNDNLLWREVRLVPKEKYPFTIEMTIYGNKIALASFKSEEMFGIIIESKEISKTMQAIFNFFWDMLEK